MDKSIFRIIDANFNRAREGLRVIEDYCRFCLNAPELSGRCKKMRHDLSSAMSRLDRGTFIASRDTAGDVGTTISVEGQLYRKDLRDVLTAACKRLPEALRTISESAQTIDHDCAKTVEALRYQAYTLEKDTYMAINVMEKFKPVRLYVVLTCDYPVDILRIAERCAAGGADCIQLRTKELNDDEAFGCACELVNICKEHNVISIINDRVDIALVSGADGVHLGQNDLPNAAARQLTWRPLLIGASTHSLHELQGAIGDKADYVGVGPAFASHTKPGLEIAGLEYVRQASAIAKAAGVAVVAIGGITTSNVKDVLTAGADAIAVGSEIMNSPDPGDVCRRFKEVLQ